MKTIKVTGTNDPAFVDDEDYPVLSRLVWYLDTRTGQPANRIWKDKVFVLRMNRLLKPYKVNLRLTYTDGNPLNNQKDNLVYKSPAQIIQGKKKPDGHISQYKGVTYDPKRVGNKWPAHISKDHKRYFLGYHPTEVDAALAYNVAAQKLYGKDAFINEIEQPTPASDQTNGG